MAKKQRIADLETKVQALTEIVNALESRKAPTAATVFANALALSAKRLLDTAEETPSGIYVRAVELDRLRSALHLLEGL